MNKLYSLIFIALFSSSSVTAQDEWDEWEDSWEEDESPWDVSGFLEAGYGQRLQTDPLFEDQQTFNEFRLHLETTYNKGQLKWDIKADVWSDDVIKDVELDLREFNLSFSAFEHFDFKLGRQITTWGTGDLVFLNDLFPKDWQSFFSGREDTYLKAPSDSIRVSGFFDAVNLDMVWTPEFTPDRFINGSRFSFFNPIANGNIGDSDVISEVYPSKSLGNGELAMRLHKNFKGREYALYAYRGFDKQPLSVNDDFSPYFSRKNILGASVRGNLGGGLYHVEYAYHRSNDDSLGTNPWIPNSQSRFLLGYEREVIPKLNWGTQLYLEKTHDYQQLVDNSLSAEIETAENRTLITQRWTYRTMQDKLTWSLFAFYSPSDDDSYLRPVVNYRRNDDWNYSLGANLFEGERDYSFFGQFERSSNAYFRIRYHF